MLDGVENRRPPAERRRRLAAAAAELLRRTRDLERPAVVGALAATSALLVVWGVLTWAAAGGPLKLNLDLSYSANACCQMLVWTNDFSRGPLGIVDIRPGSRSTYSLPIDARQLSRVRFDPGDAAGSSVVVHRIWVSRGNRTVAELDLGAKFLPARAAETRVAGGVRFSTTGPQPSVDRFTSLSLHVGALQAFLSKVSADPLPYVVLLVLVATLVAAVVGVEGAGLVGGVLLAALVVRALPHFVWPHRYGSDVTGAVGYSAYVGIPKIREQLLIDAAVVAGAVAAGAVAALLRLRRRRVSAAGESGERPIGTLPRRAHWAPIALLVVLALLFVPDLRAALAAERGAAFQPTWDATNLVFWDYLSHLGLLPVRDFYYPYGFQFLFALDAPWGPIVEYLSYMAFWGYLVIGTYWVLRRFSPDRSLLPRFSAVAAVVLTCAFAGQLPEASRYIGAIGVVLLFSSALGATRVVGRERILFAVAAAHLLLFEVAQGAYAVVAIGVIVVVDLLLAFRSSGWRAMRRVAAAAAGLVAAPAAIAAIVLAATGLLGGTADFYGQLSNISAAGSVPTRAVFWITHPDDLSGFIIWAVVLTGAVAAYGIVADRRATRRHALVLALGALGFMMLQKNVIRPGIEASIWLPATYGLLLWLVLGAPSPGGLRRVAVVAGFVGAVAGLTLQTGGYGRGVDALGASPKRLARSVASLAVDEDAFSAAGRTRFGPQHFAAFAPESAVVRELRQLPRVRAGGRVWVLGDRSGVTMLLGRSWPYYYNELYGTSPLAFQHDLIRRLRRFPPAVTVWNREDTAFDGVPYVVRDPLVMTWAVDHLRPLRTDGSWEILRPRRSREPVALGWWRSRLGEVVDLEHVAEATQLPSGSCVNGADCHSYAVVDFAPGAPVPASASVSLSAGGLSFRVAFAGTPGVHRYVIDLDRTWFWAVSPPRTRSLDRASVGGATITIVRRRGGDVLY